MRMDAARALAETVRAALVEAAREAYEDAGFAGLCAEGRWERALDAVRALDLDAVIGARPDAPPEAEARPGGD
jgi:hypothetical protein